MTLRYDANGKPVGLDWGVCTDGTSRPEVWSNWRSRKPKEPGEEQEGRTAPSYSRARISPATERQIIRMYTTEGRTAREIAEAAGVKMPTVFRVLKRNGVPPRGRTAQRVVTPEQVSEIIRLYGQELRSSEQIAVAVGADARTVRRTLIREGVPLRSASEAASLDRARRAAR